MPRGRRRLPGCIRTTVSFRPETMAMLRQLADERGRSLAGTIEDAVFVYASLRREMKQAGSIEVQVAGKKIAILV